MGVIRDKLTWNAMKKFVRMRDVQVLIIALPLAGLFICGTFWANRWDFLEASTFQVVFSTLAMVFGALLGLLVVAVFFLFDTFGNLIDKYVNLTDKSQDFVDKCTELKNEDTKVQGILENQEVKLKGLRAGERDSLRELMKSSKDLVTKSVEHLKTLNLLTDRFRKEHTESREGFIKISLRIFCFLLIVLCYSLIISSLTPFLITNKAIAGMIIILFGSVIPIFGILFLRHFVIKIKDIEKLYKDYENWYSLYKESYKNFENMSAEIKETHKIIENRIRTKRL